MSDEDRPDNDIQASGHYDFVEQNCFSLALRWRSKPESGLSHRIGVSRSRNSLLCEITAYLYNDDGLGANFFWQLGYNASDRCIFRWNNHYYFRDQTNDLFWQNSCKKLTQFDEKMH